MTGALYLLLSGLALAVAGLTLLDVATRGEVSRSVRDLAAGARAARKLRAARAQRLAYEAYLLAERPPVVHVGDITSDGGDDFVIESGWQFNLPPRWVAHPYAAERFSDGEWRVFGYTRRELTELYARRSEFNL